MAAKNIEAVSLDQGVRNVRGTVPQKVIGDRMDDIERLHELCVELYSAHQRANVTLLGGIGAGILALAGVVTIPAGIAAIVAALIAGIGQAVVADLNLNNAAGSAEALLSGIAERATGWPAIAKA